MPIHDKLFNPPPGRGGRFLWQFAQNPFSLLGKKKNYEIFKGVTTQSLDSGLEH